MWKLINSLTPERQEICLIYRYSAQSGNLTTTTEDERSEWQHAAIERKVGLKKSLERRPRGTLECLGIDPGVWDTLVFASTPSQTSCSRASVP